MPSASELMAQQAALQAEARTVEADLQVDELFGGIGEVVRVGSAALGLMVWRDLDLTVVCDKLALEPVVQVAGKLASHPRVRRVEFRNDSGHWITNPDQYPDGLYLGIGYRTPTGADWKLDVWFVDEPERQPDLAHVRSMPGELPRKRVKRSCSSRAPGRADLNMDLWSAVSMSIRPFCRPASARTTTSSGGFRVGWSGRV